MARTIDSGPPVSVSVVVPTFNRAGLVARAVRSVLAQTVGDFELLVVDDGSTDATPGVLAAIGDPRVKPLRLDRNGGVSRARNAAIAQARGPWIAFLDDDNEWAPTYLERLLATAAARPDADVVFCRGRRVDARTGRDVGRLPAIAATGSPLCDIARGWKPATSAMMVRRTRLLAVGGFHERLRVGEDWDLCFRLAQVTPFAGIDDVLLTRHELAGGRLSDRSDFYADAIALLQERCGTIVAATCGPWQHRRWAVGLELLLARKTLTSGRRLDAVRAARRMTRLLPWSAPALARALIFAALGPRRYAILSTFMRSHGHR